MITVSHSKWSVILRTTLFTIVMILVFTLPTSILAQSETLTLADDQPLVLTAAVPVGMVTVLNNTNEEITITAKIDQLDSAVIAGLMIFPEGGIVPAAGSLTLKITLQADLPQDTYEGSLVISGKDVVIRHPIQIQTKLAESPATPLTPLVSEWAVDYYNDGFLIPFDSCFRGCDLAVRLPKMDADKFIALNRDAAEPLGVLYGDNGIIIPVVTSGNSMGINGPYLEITIPSKITQDDIAGSTLDLALQFYQDPKIGTYKGSIDLIPADDTKGDITLTIKVTNHWSVAVFWLFLSVLVATIGQWYIGTERIRQKLYIRSETLNRKLEDANQKFKQGSGVNPYSEYHLDFTKDLEGFENKVKSLQGFPKINEADIIEIEKIIKEYETFLNDWPVYPETLKILMDQSNEIRTAATTGLKPSSTGTGQSFIQEPAILDHIRKLLNPGTSPTAPPYPENLDVVNLRKLQEKVNLALAFATFWLASETIVQNARKRLNILAPCLKNSDSDREQVDQLANIAEGAHADLWSKTSEPEVLEEWREREFDASFDSTLRGLEDKCKKLLLSKKPSPGLESARDATTTILPEDSWGNPIIKLLEGIEFVKTEGEMIAQTTRLRRLIWLLRAGDVIYVLIALVVVIVLGIEVLYLGAPYGSTWDILKTVIWGFAGKLGLDTLNSALGRLGENLAE